MHARICATIPMDNNIRPTVKARISHCRPMEMTWWSMGHHGTSWDHMGPMGSPPQVREIVETPTTPCALVAAVPLVTQWPQIPMDVDSILFTSMCRGAKKMGMGQTFGGWTSGIHMYSPRALTHSHILVYWVVIPVTSRYSILDLHRLYHQLSFWLRINPHNRIVFS